MLVDLALVVVGLALLGRAADRFVVAAARLAVSANVSPLVIGTVLVGFGTSTPEMLVSGLAAGRGELELGVGNIMGSNLANLTLVLGVAALVSPPTVVPGVMRREAPLSFVAVVLFAVLVQGGLDRWSGVVLLVALVGGIFLLLRSAGPRSHEQPTPDLVEEIAERAHETGHEQVTVRRELVIAVVTLAGTMLGAHLLVDGAIGVADELGISGGFVGLTLVAVGTSLPELVTGVQAMRRGEDQLLIGNVLGSNLFNSLAVGGIAALVGPAAITDASLTVVAGVVMVVVVLMATLFLAGGRVKRWQAAVLVVVYLATVPLMA